MPPITNRFLEALAAGQTRVVRKDTVSVDTTASALVRPSVRRSALVVTNLTSNQLDLSWENPTLAASGGEFVLLQGESYIELFDTRAGGIGEPIWGTLHAIKTTGAQNVRVVEYEVYF